MINRITGLMISTNVKFQQKRLGICRISYLIIWINIFCVFYVYKILQSMWDQAGRDTSIALKISMYKWNYQLETYFDLYLSIYFYSSSLHIKAVLQDKFVGTSLVKYPCWLQIELNCNHWHIKTLFEKTHTEFGKIH